MQGAFPINRRHQATTGLVLGLDALFIAAQAEWEELYAGRIDEVGIAKARLRLMNQMHDLQAKHLPTSLPRRDKLFRLAEEDAAAYFTYTYTEELKDE